MYQTGCRYFSGYKPCEKNSQCDEGCPSRDIPRISILVIHLGAMGAVLRATALLPMIKKKYPFSKITWITDSPELLENNPNIDHIYKNADVDTNKLFALNFDIALVVDKAIEASVILSKANVDLVYGFVTDPNSGAIVPATPAAFELWELGLNNYKKFYLNKKTELQLQAEALELTYNRERYGVYLLAAELNEAYKKKIIWSSAGKKKVIGFNTGCGPLLPEKKLPISKWRELLNQIQNHYFLMERISIVLLGGPSERVEHEILKKEFQFLHLSSVDKGLRDGLVSIEACDLLITGDSLGMHMGIGLKKYVVAWFGPSCAQEIDLYDRGEQIQSATMPCSPCWKRSCDKDHKCNESIAAEVFIGALERGLDFLEQAPQILDSEKTKPLKTVIPEDESYQMPHEFMNLMTEMIL